MIRPKENGAKPAWSLTDKDVERMIAVFARTLAVAIVAELKREGIGWPR